MTRIWDEMVVRLDVFGRGRALAALAALVVVAAGVVAVTASGESGDVVTAPEEVVIETDLPEAAAEDSGKTPGPREEPHDREKESPERPEAAASAPEEAAAPPLAAASLSLIHI